MRKKRQIKGEMRRMAVAFLAAVMLTFTVAGDCVVPPVQASATGLEIDILLAIIEAAMASMGMSYSSTADLNNAANALQYGMDNNYQYAVQGTDLFAGLKEGLKSSTAKSLILPATVWVALQDFLYNMSASDMSSASDIVSDSVASGIVTKFGVSVEFVDSFGSNSDLLYGNSILKAYDSTNEGKAGLGENFNVDFGALNAASIVIIGICSNLSVCIQMSNDDKLLPMNGYYVFSNDNDVGTNIYRYCTRAGGYVSDDVRRHAMINYKSDFDGYMCESSFTIPLSYVREYSAGAFVCDGVPYSSYGVGQSFTRVKVRIKPGTKVYPSIQAGALMEGALSLYKPQSKVYGLSSSAGSKSVTKNDDGTVTLSNLQTGLTQAVQQAVDAALANNPAITEEQLNAIVAQVIASNEGIKDEISSELEEQTGVLTGLLTAIKLVVDANTVGLNGIAEDIADLQESINDMSITDGTGALQLQEDVADIKDQFKVIEGGGGNAGDNDEEPHEPKVWVPGTFKVPTFLSGLVSFLTAPFLIMTDGIRQIWLNISSLPENISASFKDWLEPLLQGLGFANGIQILPGQGFKDWLEPLLQGLSIANGVLIKPGQEFKDWLEPLIRGIGFANGIEIFPGQEFKDWLEPLLQGLGLANGLTLPQLDTIQDILTEAFVIDTAQIMDAAQGIDDVWKGVFPYDGVSGLFDGFRFTDNYAYPVIKMSTPPVLQQFYTDDYIVFLDFGGDMFRKYCLWVRGLAKVFIWFKFALRILSKFKVSFHIA